MLNKVTLIGHVGQDPELKNTTSGSSVCNFSLATNETWKDKTGTKQTRTEWHSCVAWGKTGETIARYCSKGQQLYVEGRLRTEKWDNNGVTHYRTKVNLTEFKFLGGPKKQQGGGAQTEMPQEDDNDFPF
jgi:single-strand DNA-binding protein